MTGKKMSDINAEKFQSALKRAVDGKLKVNYEICGFLLLAPLNKREYTNVLFYGNQVATVSGGKITLTDCDDLVWKDNDFKRAGFYSLVEKYNEQPTVDDVPTETTDVTGESSEPIIELEEPMKPAAKPKRKPSRRKSTKK